MSVPSTINDWLVEFADDARGVRAFCDQHDLDEPARTTIRLARQIFPSGSRVTLRVRQDPESDHEWLAVDVAVQAPVEEALAYYGRLVEQWVEAIPAPARDRMGIKFSIA